MYQKKIEARTNKDSVHTDPQRLNPMLLLCYVHGVYALALYNDAHQKNAGPIAPQMATMLMIFL